LRNLVERLHYSTQKYKNQRKVTIQSFLIKILLLLTGQT
jgi:hypothetical protein